MIIFDYPNSNGSPSKAAQPFTQFIRLLQREVKGTGFTCTGRCSRLPRICSSIISTAMGLTTARRTCARPHALKTNATERNVTLTAVHGTKGFTGTGTLKNGVFGYVLTAPKYKSVYLTTKPKLPKPTTGPQRSTMASSQV